MFFKSVKPLELEDNNNLLLSIRHVTKVRREDAQTEHLIQAGRLRSVVTSVVRYSGPQAVRHCLQCYGDLFKFGNNKVRILCAQDLAFIVDTFHVSNGRQLRQLIITSCRNPNDTVRLHVVHVFSEETHLLVTERADCSLRTIMCNMLAERKVHVLLPFVQGFAKLVVSTMRWRKSLMYAKQIQRAANRLKDEGCHTVRTEMEKQIEIVYQFISSGE